MRQSQHGFGLIEVMVSMLLLGVAALAGLAVLGAAIHSTAHANGLQTASRLGQDVIDRALTEPFDSLTGTSADPVCRSPVDPAPVHASPQGGSAGNFTTYTRSCTVTDLAADFKAVRVTVTWTDSRDGRAHGVTLGMNRAR